jgi:hypothetical protein
MLTHAASISLLAANGTTLLLTHLSPKRSVLSPGRRMAFALAVVFFRNLGAL